MSFWVDCLYQINECFRTQALDPPPKLSFFGAVGARDHVRSSFSQRALSMTRTLTQDLSVF